MAELLLKGHRLNSAAAIREVIADMRKTLEAPDMELHMSFLAEDVGRDGICHACAGGSAVIWGFGAVRDASLWSKELVKVAMTYDRLRLGMFSTLEMTGYPFPEAAISAYSESMKRNGHPDFFPAWERFADAVETAEKVGS